MLLIPTITDYVLWDLSAGTIKHRWPGAHQAGKGVFAPDGRSVVTYDAVLQRWMVLPRSKLVKGLQAQLEEDWYITQKAPVNKALDQRILVGLKRLRSFGYGYAPPDFWDTVP